MSITFAGKPVADPNELYQCCKTATPRLPVERWLDRANIFDVTRGERPGTGAVLMTQEDLDAVDQTTSHSMVFHDDQSSTATTLKKISVTNAYCVVPSTATNGSNVYLVELADRRIELAKIPIAKAYNVRKPDGSAFFDATRDGSSDWTWQTMFDDVWGLLGLGSAPALPFTPHGTPEGFDFYGGTAWAALNAILDRLACSIALDVEADTFTLYRLGTTTDSAGTAAVDGSSAAPVTTCWDEYPIRANRGSRPESVRVLFRRFPAPTEGTNPFYSVDVMLAAADGVIGGSILTIQDDMAALGETGTPSNSSSLSSRANERAADWLRKYESCDMPFVRQYRGFRSNLTKAVGPKYVGVGYEDRGAGFRSQALAATTMTLENFKAPPVPIVFDSESVFQWVKISDGAGVLSAGTGGDSSHKAKLSTPDGDGTWTETVDIRVKSRGSDMFVNTKYEIGSKNGTVVESVEGKDVTFDLYWAQGYTFQILNVCVDKVTGEERCDKWIIPDNFTIISKVDCDTGEPL